MGSLAIESTPLGLARKTIEAALSDVNDAMVAWEEAGEKDPASDDFPYGDHDTELRPDTESYGFELVFNFSDRVGPDASLMQERLRAVCEKHGIARVTVLGVNADSADVEAFNE